MNDEYNSIRIGWRVQITLSAFWCTNARCTDTRYENTVLILKYIRRTMQCDDNNDSELRLGNG